MPETLVRTLKNDSLDGNFVFTKAEPIDNRPEKAQAN